MKQWWHLSKGDKRQWHHLANGEKVPLGVTEIIWRAPNQEPVHISYMDDEDVEIYSAMAGNIICYSYGFIKEKFTGESLIIGG